MNLQLRRPGSSLADMRQGYGQFCPVAVASEIFAERWTPIILRELLLGSRRFNDIHRGAPRISRALLAHRLRELEKADVIESVARPDGNGREYRLTTSGEELGDLVVRLGEWGQRWTTRVDRKRLDAVLLMWDMRRRIAVHRLPVQRTVVRFDFRGVPAGHRHAKAYWMVLERSEVDVCMKDPGFEVDVYVDADLAALTRVWLGDEPLAHTLRAGTVKLSGDPRLSRAFPSWLMLSTLAAVPRPGEQAQRRVA
jgi:DNA-binding HxlR family transcriptional regulator